MLDKLSYQQSEQAAAKSKLYIYDNKIKIRAKDNILSRPCGIRALGDYYSKDDKETGTKAGIYRIYNINVGTDAKGNSMPNTISVLPCINTVMKKEHGIHFRPHWTIRFPSGLSTTAAKCWKLR